MHLHVLYTCTYYVQVLVLDTNVPSEMRSVVVSVGDSRPQDQEFESRSGWRWHEVGVAVTTQRAGFFAPLDPREYRCRGCVAAWRWLPPAARASAGVAPAAAWSWLPLASHRRTEGGWRRATNEPTRSTELGHQQIVCKTVEGRFRLPLVGRIFRRRRPECQCYMGQSLNYSSLSLSWYIYYTMIVQSYQIQPKLLSIKSF